MCDSSYIYNCLPYLASLCSGDRYITHFYCLAVEAGFYSKVVECLPLDPAAQARFPPRAVGIFLHPVTFGGHWGSILAISELYSSLRRTDLTTGDILVASVGAHSLCFGHHSA